LAQVLAALKGAQRRTVKVQVAEKELESDFEPLVAVEGEESESLAPSQDQEAPSTWFE
jgi:hypothetical protein